MRHMMNWTVGREHLDRTPFRRGTGTLIRRLREDNQRRRRLSEAEKRVLLEVAAPFLRSMIITAVDTGMRRGEMLALRFADIDWKRQLIVLRGETTKSRKTRAVPSAVNSSGASTCAGTLNHHNRAIRQPEAREPPGRGCATRGRQDLRFESEDTGITDRLSSFRQESNRRTPIG